MSHTNPAGPLPKLAGEPRQLVFLALCSLALVVAAFAAPPTAQGSSSPDVPLGDLFGNESGQTGDCVVLLSENPVPGRDVTVAVRRGGEPIQDVRVWFDDRSIGVTNRSGQVTGTVPYVRKLSVKVGLPGGGSCEFETVTGGTAVQHQSAALGAPAGSSNLAGNAAPETGQSTGQAAAQATDSPTPTRPTDAVNVSDSFRFLGPIGVDVVGEPNPGETVTLVATIRGDPVPAATVSVDGDRVGRTDENGEYALTIPDDGTERLRVNVQRGEIEGRTFVDVRLLRVAVQGERFPLPGQSATVRAAIGTDAAADAAVTLDGERVATTNATGQAAITLPGDPLATVTVTTGDRTASRSMLSVFAPTIVTPVAALLLLVGSPLAVYWADGRRGLAVLVALAANLLAGTAGYVVAGRDGALVAVGSTLLLLALVLAVRRPDLVSGAGDRLTALVTPGGSAGDVARSWIDRVTDGVLWITRRVERLVDRIETSLGAVLRRLREFELAALLADVRTLFGGLPRRFVAGIRFLVGLPRRLLGSILPGSSDDESEVTDPTGQPTPERRPPGPAIRELWRRFARRVVPDRWPQRTPGEVSRQAIDAGFPRDSVVELTSVFRDVEYGGESLSDDRYLQAQRAYDALDAGENESDGTDGDGATDADDGGEVSGS
ncbi:protein of unknown function [Halomicrobium zhouii]|uniref:Protein-glutamine gamma-glutamyltransferase-like C-terminal domain-containing protein n=1 Tax=Halomicrobium zhouii TaxID=767519 RepID=A0A1I6LYR6_9EURY|nr:DUF4129 domain-containing protein [Halomicrobium zhouii]SFS08422.1 protein of unknown function [Halomicrobium zhouii]